MSIRELLSSSIWLIVLGAWLACYLGATDGMIAINDVGNRLVSHGGVVLVAISVAALIAAMAMNAYSAMLTVLTGIDSFFKDHAHEGNKDSDHYDTCYPMALRGGRDPIRSCCCSFQRIGNDALPTRAMDFNLVDYFLIRRRKYAILDMFQLKGVYNVWAWRGLVAYALGFAVSAPFFTVPGLFEGPLAKKLGDVDVSWVVGLLVSGILYYVLMLSVDLNDEASFVRASEQELDR